jgi:hypothetical protein
MKKDKPRPKARKEGREIRELIRVKIDITGLRQEDIDFLRNHANTVLDKRSC